MKKLILLILLLPLFAKAQTYQLNYDSIRVGKTAGTGGTSLYGKVYLKNVGLGLVSDSILTVLNGRIRKIPTISQFWQRSGTTLSPTTSGDNVAITVSNANGLIVTNNSATEAAISSRNNGSGNIHQFLNTTGAISAINNSGLLEKVGGTDAQFLRANGTVLGSTGSGDVVRATSPTLTTPNIGNATGGTLSLSGLLTSTQGNNTQIFNSATATTGYQFGRMTNTSGALLWGIEGSAAGTLLTGGSAYGGVLTTGTSTNLELGTDQIIGIKIDGSNRKITMPELGGAGDVIIGANNTGLLGEIAIGSGLSLSGGVLTATGGSSGSVTTSGGTAGKITKFTSASNVENSIMTESSGLIDVTGDLTANIVTADVGHKYNFGAANRGGIYGYSTLSGSGTDYTPTYYSESGLGANFYVDGGLTKGFTIATTGDATFSGSISSPDDIPFVLSSPTTVDFHQSGGGTVRFVNDAFSAVNMSITNAGDVGVRGALIVTGAASASNLSGTNTGDQTTITGNAATATALQTARTIGTLTGDVTSAGSSFDGTGNNTNATTLATVNANVGSFGSSTSIPTFTVNGKGLITAASGNAVIAPAGTLTGSTLAAGVTASSLTSVGTLANLTVTNPITGSITGNAATVTTNANLTGIVTSTGNATAIADAALSIAKTSGLQSALDAKAPLASPALTGNPTAPTQTAGDNSTKIATTAYVDRLGGGTVTSGTYTPTITNSTNVSSTTAVKCHYIRVGNEVTVTGRFLITTTSSNTLTLLRITLPISSNLASTGDLDGSGSTQTDGGPVYIYEDTTNDAASFELYPTGTLVGIGVGFTFTYTVL